ncbi:MAG TPA: methylated-DNA--[protein]-cysteine S-methyltransferase [Acidimicrobiia bacterium]
MIESQLAQLKERAPSANLLAVELGAGLVDGYNTYDSPLGPVMVAFNPAGVSMVDLEDEAEDRFHELFGRRLVRAKPPEGWDRLIGAAIEAGTPGSLPLDLRVHSEFRRTVLMAAGTIPRGEVRSYGWLAQQAGHPRAFRAVGSTMAANTVPLIIPCHRVVRSDGSIGQYSMGGPENKVRLLELEAH